MLPSANGFTFYSCLQYEIYWFLIENKIFIQFTMCMVFPPSAFSRSSHFLTHPNPHTLLLFFSSKFQRTIRNFKNICTEMASWDINSPKTAIKFTLFYPFTGRHGDSLIVICISIVSPLEINSFWFRDNDFCLLFISVLGSHLGIPVQALYMLLHSV